MAQYNRPPKTKAPKPDEFISFFDRLTRYFLLHQNKFWMLVMVAVLAFGAYGLYRYRIGQRLHEMALDYMKADQSRGAEALQAWERLRSLKPPAPLAQVVELQVGGSLAATQKWAEAAQAFQQSAADKSFLLAAVAKLAAATALENAEKYSEALAAYQEIAGFQDSPFRYRGSLGAARAYAALGQPTEAENILFPLLLKNSDAPEAVKNAAMNQLVVLKLKPAAENPETSSKMEQ
ncbi:MAG TPA: hypothetical protein DF383_06760 [Deltaproteobacteria bacterium]|nr:hypothetical protein [Deltaproteobacteria bacterium]